MSVLERDLFEEYLADCGSVGLRPELMRVAALAALRHHQKPKEDRYAEILALEDRWYRSLEGGAPDWSVYGDPSYVADLWACWAVYSRKYLRAIRSPKSLPPTGIAAELEGVAAAADLGCGFGYTSAALRELFPGAEIVGTNLADISQTAIARRVGRRYGFRVVPTVGDVERSVDLVFASEYFEHIPDPIDHLYDVLDELRPTALLIANCFGGRSIGHFDLYEVNGGLEDGRTTARLFGRALRERGYRRVETRLWNNRPSYWVN